MVWKIIINFLKYPHCNSYGELIHTWRSGHKIILIKEIIPSIP